MNKPYLKPITPTGTRPTAPVNTAPPPDFTGIKHAVQEYAVEKDIPHQTSPRAEVSAGQAAPPSRALTYHGKTWERFTVEIPTYLYEDIQKRLGAKRQTKKSVVLNAFHAAGFFVAPEDLVEDLRRER